MVTQQSGSTQLKFECKSCMDKDRPTAGPPSTVKIDGFTACVPCYLERERKKIEANGSVLQKVHKRSEGDTRARIEIILGLWKPEVAETYSGTNSADRKGRPREASNRASDLVGFARLELAEAVLAACRQRADQARVELEGEDRDKLLKLIDNNIAFATQELEKAKDLVSEKGKIDFDRPKKLEFRERRRFWSLTSTALRAVSGLPTSIKKLLEGTSQKEDFARASFQRIAGKADLMETITMLLGAQTEPVSTEEGEASGEKQSETKADGKGEEKAARPKRTRKSKDETTA